jgi:hypothetical protein
MIQSIPLQILYFGSDFELFGFNNTQDHLWIDFIYNIITSKYPSQRILNVYSCKAENALFTFILYYVLCSVRYN